jgi:NADH-quinone oxidoreductase subunit N
MTTEMLQAAAASNQWWAIGPEMILAGSALALLAAEIVLPRKEHRLIPWLALMAQAAVLVGLVLNFHTSWLNEATFNGLLLHTMQGQIGRVFFTVAAMLVTFLGLVCLPRSKMPRVEFFALVQVITAAMMLLGQSNHFVLFFVALETVTIGFYILVSYYRDNALTLEAGLKYLVTGALSSSILLFGIVLLYGAVGRSSAGLTGFDFGAVRLFLQENPDNFLGVVGALLLLSGVAFKIGAFPFQVWVPDVYQGAPTPVTAFLAVSSKAAGFAVLLVLARTVFAPIQWIMLPVISAMAAATILFGNLAALSQRHPKRLMGLSGVSHAGFLLMGVAASFMQPWAASAVWFYLFTYLLASMAVFGVMAHVVGENDADMDLDRYDRLSRDQPLLAGVLAVGVGSLAGIPPLAGFIGKLLVFIAAFQAGLHWLLAVAIVGVVVSIFYYFGWIKAAFFETWRLDHEQPPAQPRQPVAPLSAVVLVTLALATVALGLFQSPLASWVLSR